MREYQKLAKRYNKIELQEIQKGISIAIDSAKGLRLAGLRRRYWTLEKAIDEKRSKLCMK